MGLLHGAVSVVGRATLDFDEFWKLENGVDIVNGSCGTHGSSANSNKTEMYSLEMTNQ